MTTLLGKTTAFLTAAALAGVLTSCGASAADLPPESDTSWEATVQRANAQGEVRFYTVAVPSQNEALVKAFNEAYPQINVKVERGGPEIPARVSSELQSGTDGADVILNAGQQWYIDHQEHLLDADGPASENWPQEALTGSAATVSYVPAGFITWNTDIFPNGFSNWEDLQAPEVKGKLGMRNIVDNVVGSHLKFLADTNGEDYLTGLAEQQPKFYESVSPLTQAVGSGEVGVSVLSTPAMAKGLQENGAPLDYTIPEKSWSSVYLAAALDTSKRPDAARVFLDFMMSHEGQAALNGNDYGGSPLKDIPGTVDTTGMTVLDDASFGPAKVDQWADKFDHLFANSGGSSK